MTIYTIPEFELYYHNTYKKSTMHEAFWATLPIERFKLTKKKVTKKRKTDVVPGKFEIPTLITTDPKMTKDAFDTNKFTDLIIAYLKSVHSCNSARRISSEGRYRKGIGYIAGLNKGMEDIQCVLKGRLFAIEIKSPNDRISPDQLKRKAALEKDGGVYIVAEGFEQLQEEILSILK
jgi:hypothetical protein